MYYQKQLLLIGMILTMVASTDTPVSYAEKRVQRLGKGGQIQFSRS